MKARNTSTTVLTLSYFIGLANATNIISADEIMEAPLRFICSFDTVIRIIVGPIAALLIVAMGAKYLTSEDDERERNEAKDRIKHILLGLIIVLLGRAIVEIILSPPPCP